MWDHGRVAEAAGRSLARVAAGVLTWLATAALALGLAVGSAAARTGGDAAAGGGPGFGGMAGILATVVAVALLARRR